METDREFEIVDTLGKGVLKEVNKYSAEIGKVYSPWADNFVKDVLALGKKATPEVVRELGEQAYLEAKHLERDALRRYPAHC